MKGSETYENNDMSSNWVGHVICLSMEIPLMRS